ncbi:hypothetical protein [Oceaniglobus ichthyenteri]|uniref:hypothetical protein n=1 Tax=Oceaniglobus ichthyenteri TaxID=2136177 RepID=UPI0013DE7155|nr:hypothetical protein [Oceaniglobus ichthyenteri]
MNWILAALAFVTFSAFIGILIFAVPSPDLIAVAVLTMALVIYDLATSAGRKS